MPDTRWVDVAGLTTLLVVLTVMFDRFERHKPMWRRIGKIAALVALVLVLIETTGRAWAYGVLGLLLAAGATFHFFVLSRAGINGWTGEPREKFDTLLYQVRTHGELRTLASLARPRRRSSP